MECGGLPRVHLVSDATSRIPTTRPRLADEPGVSVKALAVVLDPARSRHLVFRARNQAGQEFNRPLGGTVELGERTVDAVVREIREEIDATFVPAALLGVVENIFELDGQLGHEIDFLYVGSIAESNAVPDAGCTFDDVGSPGWAEWRPVAEPSVDVALYPTGLQGLLDDWLDARS